MTNVKKSLRTVGLLVLTISLGLICFFNKSEINFPLSKEISLNSPYIVRDYGPLRYILDNQRTRILVVEKESNVVRHILPPSGKQPDNFYYADDFLVDEDGNVYVKEGAWDGNRIFREAVLVYDASGRYKATYLDTPYDKSLVNKHKIMLLSIRNGTIKYAVKEKDRIDIFNFDTNNNQTEGERLSIPFENAFNFVNDMTEDSEGNLYAVDKPGNFFILEKNTSEGGKAVSQLKKNDGNSQKIQFGKAKLIYKSSKSEFPNWIEVPSSGKLLFAELYSDCVKELDIAAGKTSVVLENSGSVTVTPEAFSKIENPLTNKRMIQKQFVFILFFLLFVICLIYLLITLIVFFMKRKIHIIKRISVYMVIIVVAVAGVITFRLTNEFAKVMQNQILAQMENMAYSVANTIKPSTLDSIQSAADFASPAYREMISNMENVIDPSLDINRNVYCDIFKYDEEHGAYACAYLDQAIGTYFPLTEGEIEEIKQIYKTGTSFRSAKDDTSASYIYVSVPVMNDERKVSGVVSVMMETYMFTGQINEMRRNVLLGILVTVIFVWLLMGEALSYILSKSQAQMELEHQKALGKIEEKSFPHYYIRLMVFALFATYNMTTTFLPMVVTKGALESLGENCSSFIAALPLSINLFAVGLMALFCEGIIRKIGYKKIIIFGSALSGLGNLILFFFSSNYVMLFIALVLDGIGVGLTTNSMYLMVSQIPNPKNRTAGYTAYNAAQTSGINFGMLFGAALAPNFSRNAIFPMVTAMWAVSAVIFVLLWRTLKNDTAVEKKSAVSEKDKTIRRTLKFLSHRRVWSYILLVQAPFVLMGSFVYYYLPIYSDTNGLSEVMVAVLMMLYSLFAIYLGNGLTKWVISRTKAASPYMSILLCAVACVIFAIMGNFTGLLIAIFILGLANGFGRSVQQSHFSILPECEKYGITEAMGIFNFTDFIGQSFGPTVMALVFLSKRITLSTGIFTVILVILSALHFCINLKKEKRIISATDK